MATEGDLPMDAKGDAGIDGQMAMLCRSVLVED